MYFSVFIGLILLVSLQSCNRVQLDKGSQYIAKVNDEPIPAKEFINSFTQLKAEQDEISLKNPKLLDQLKANALNEVILLTLVRLETTKRLIKIAKEEVESRLANWKDGYPPGGFEEMLKKQNTTEDYLKKRIEDQLLVEKFMSVAFREESLVSDEEVKLFYQGHHGQFEKPERIHAFQIVVPTKEEAEKIRGQIISGKMTFESAARTHSLSPDSSKGGDLGFFAKNEKIPAFNEAFSLSIGAVSKPVVSRYGTHLFKVTEKERPKTLSYNEARTEIIKRLKQQKESKFYKEWLTKLLKDGEIYRNEALYSSIN